MQDRKDSRSTVSDCISEPIPKGLSDTLSELAKHLRPEKFRAQFGLRFGTLLGATGLDWSLQKEEALNQTGLNQSHEEPGRGLAINLPFNKGERFLVLESALPGLTSNIIETVLNSMQTLAADWLHTVESSPSQSNQTSLRETSWSEDHFTTRVSSSSDHLPAFLPARLAHKLRNYLTPILTGAGQILETASLQDNVDQTAMAEIVSQGAQQQDALLSRFLLAYGPLEIQHAQINLTDLLKSILSAYRARGRRSLEVAQPDNEIICYQDDNLLRIIYGEIIDNALEANGDDPIAISLFHTEEAVSLQIVNNGKSTVEEIEASFFTPFYSRKSNHDGLGLPIARRLARELGGDLRCLTTPDAICFEVEIPRNLNRL